jgi:hypothetical protein
MMEYKIVRFHILFLKSGPSLREQFKIILQARCLDRIVEKIVGILFSIRQLELLFYFRSNVSNVYMIYAHVYVFFLNLYATHCQYHNSL